MMQDYDRVTKAAMALSQANPLHLLVHSSHLLNAAVTSTVVHDRLDAALVGPPEACRFPGKALLAPFAEEGCRKLQSRVERSFSKPCTLRFSLPKGIP
jgi:hypothetical protein